MLQVFFEGLTSSNYSRQADFTLLQNQLQLGNYPVHRSLLYEGQNEQKLKKLHKVKTSAFSNRQKARELMYI